MKKDIYQRSEYIKTTLPEKYAISRIVFQYRIILGEVNKPISLRKLANQLNHILNPIGGNISHQSIKNWEDKKHLPNAYWILQLLRYADSSWCRDFAQDILSVIEPQRYSPASIIAKDILSESNSQVIQLTHQLHYTPAYAS